MKCNSHRLAERDLLQAIAYYNGRAPSLGSEFLDAFDEGVSLLRRHPRAGPAVRGAIRRLSMARFPYNIIYRIAADSIRILAVAHQKRSPHYWESRR